MEKPLICVPLQIRPSLIAGRGVFALKKIKKGEIIEECPVLFVKEYCESLKNYFFNWSEDPPVGALPLGYGLLYNHADAPNASWSVDPDRKLMIYTAVNDIAADDEIFVSYGDRWFEARNMIKKYYKYQRVKRIIGIVIKTVIVALALVVIRWFILHLKAKGHL